MRHLLCDFGGPLLRLPFEMRAEVAAKLGVPESDIPGGPLDPDDDRWRAAMRGEITQRDYWAEVAERFGLDTHGLMSLIYEPSGDHVIRTEAMTLIEEVQASGCKAGLLSNDLEAFMGAEWQRPITVLETLDPVIDLSFAEYLKPDPRAFADGIAAMGVDAGDIVFVDDSEENVDGAVAVGLIGVLFDTADQDGSFARVRDALEASG
jgi:putative hydrolase of the HAD superfamily